MRDESLMSNMKMTPDTSSASMTNANTAKANISIPGISMRSMETTAADKMMTNAFLYFVHFSAIYGVLVMKRLIMSVEKPMTYTAARTIPMHPDTVTIPMADVRALMR